MGTFTMNFNSGSSNIPITFCEQKSMHARFGQVYSVTINDYEKLINLPSINGITLIGDTPLTDFGMPIFYFDTTENWATKGMEVSEKNAVYVYTDRGKTKDGRDIAGIKIGDGLAYIVDLPFTDEAFIEHINDKTIHITQEEREFWNNKNRAYVSPAQAETLVLTTF